MRLQDKVAVITGAAGDVGGAAARLFCEQGARLALLDRDKAGLAALAAALPNGATCIGADVTSEDALQAAAGSVHADLGRVDILFVNAGVEQSNATITEMTKAAFESVLSINLVGAFLTAKSFLPVMADGGSVIFTSSTAALMPFPAYSAYSASKAGLVGMMRSASVDVAPRRIRCNTIHPGPVRSRMLERSAAAATNGGDTEAWYGAMAGAARMGRLVEPEEVAALALFLASDESRMITGQSLRVDGGVVH